MKRVMIGGMMHETNTFNPSVANSYIPERHTGLFLIRPAALHLQEGSPPDISIGRDMSFVAPVGSGPSGR